MKLNFRRQAGATLLETMMVVALMAVITIGALVYFNSASESSKVQEATAGLTALSSVLRNQFATQGDYTGLNETLAMKFGNVPESMLVRTGAGAAAVPTRFKHPWNQAAGAVTISVATTNVANDSYKISYADVPAASCVDLLTKTYRHFDAVTAGTTAVTSVATAVSGCGTNGDVDISWTAR
jgi:Tfp pilus assembly protein PilE